MVCVPSAACPCCGDCAGHSSVHPRVTTARTIPDLNCRTMRNLTLPSTASPKQITEVMHSYDLTLRPRAFLPMMQIFPDQTARAMTLSPVESRESQKGWVHPITRWPEKGRVVQEGVQGLRKVPAPPLRSLQKAGQSFSRARGRMGTTARQPAATSRQIIPIQIHDLAPCGNEVLGKCLLRVVTGVDFRNGPELRV